MKQCPYCGEMIPAEAKKCRYCGEWLETTNSPQSQENNAEQKLQQPKAPKPVQKKHEPHEQEPPVIKPKPTEEKKDINDDSANLSEENPQILKSDPVPDSCLDAIKRCYRKLNTFEGRATCKEFWCFWLFNIIVSIALNILIAHIHIDKIKCVLYAVYLLGFFLPMVAVGTRRLHDIGKSAAWWLTGLIPVVGPIVLLVLWARRSDVDNRFGTDPETNPAEEEQPAIVSKRDKIVSAVLVFGIIIAVTGVILINKHAKEEWSSIPQDTEYEIGVEDNDSTEQATYDEEDADYIVPDGTYIGYLTEDGVASQDVRLRVKSVGKNLYHAYFLFPNGEESYCEGSVGGAHMNLQLEGISPEREAFTLTVGTTDTPGELVGGLQVVKGDYYDEHEVTLNLEQ